MVDLILLCLSCFLLGIGALVCLAEESLRPTVGFLSGGLFVQSVRIFIDILGTL